MSLENLKKANEYIKDLEKRRTERGPKLKEAIINEMRNSPVKERKPPRDFNDSSYLYIRSYDGDNGTRPGANVAYWHSPDVKVSPLASLNSYTTELNAGQAYNLKCIVHNRGDIIVPSAKVEFYLVTPSLGFDTRFARKLGIATAWVSCYSSAEVNIPYLVPASDAGHKCLFARVFSFSPLDLPVHDTILNPHADRHIGQQNLNIAAQASQMQMNILHMPIAQMRVNFMPMKKEAVMAMRHPSAADFKILEGEKFNRFLSKFKIGFANRKAAETAKLTFKGGVASFEFNGQSEYNLDAQKRMDAQMKKVYRAINSGEAKASQFKKEIAANRKMNLENTMTLLNYQIPAMGLEKGEMVGFEIVATNKLNGEVFGGITLLVIG
jgi:hypothetical protein